MFNLLFYFHIILYWEEATILPLKSKLSVKFQCFDAIDGIMEMLKYSSITKNFN